MPDEENTGQHSETDLPDKFQGKSAAEIAAMYSELESRLGRQGEELGQLRSMVSAYQASAQSRTEPAREAADKTDYARRYGKYAEDLIVSPDEVLPKFAEDLLQEAEDRAYRRVSQEYQSVTSRQRQVDRFFEDNPELGRFKEIVSVIGDQVYRANPNRPIDEILDETKRQASVYIGTLKERLEGRSADRKRAGVTTSGGNPAKQAEDHGSDQSKEPEGDPDEAAIRSEMARIREYRQSRSIPPRGR